MTSRKIKDLKPLYANIIKKNAWRLIGQHGFSWSDREDLEQEMALDLVKRFGYYDCNKSEEHTFVACIVSKKAHDLVRERYSQKRDYRKVISINDCKNEDGDGEERIIPQVHFDRDEEDLSMDMDRVLSKMPEDLRRVSELLKINSLNEVSKIIGIPRSTLRSREISRIRTILENEGLKKYLEKPSPTFRLTG